MTKPNIQLGYGVLIQTEPLFIQMRGFVPFLPQSLLFFSFCLFWILSATNIKKVALTTPTGKPVGFLLPSLACNRTSFADFGIQV